MNILFCHTLEADRERSSFVIDMYSFFFFLENLMKIDNLCSCEVLKGMRNSEIFIPDVLLLMILGPYISDQTSGHVVKFASNSVYRSKIVVLILPKTDQILWTAISSSTYHVLL